LCAFLLRTPGPRREYSQRLPDARLNFPLDDDAPEMEFDQMPDELPGEGRDQFMTD
jgi:hypothetical protein